MASSFMQYIYCFVVLTVCVDEGDGRWKKRDETQNLRHDIEVFRRMADKIEHEIETFYDEYPEEGPKVDIIEKIHHKYAQNTLSRDFPRKDGSKQEKAISQQKDRSSNENNNISQKYRPENISENITALNNRVSFKDVPKNDITGIKWPKFEDILLEMGKRYDWKNDRWIKVKEKLKTQLTKMSDIRNDVDFHEKHKFSYRIVQLNRNKRRNVVVAVSAVR